MTSERQQVPESVLPDWDSLAPWEKAQKWHKIAPNIADKVMELAREHAEQRWKAAEHRRELERAEAEHTRRMDVRLWVTQVVTVGVGMLNVTVFALVAWHYADTGNVVPGLTMLGAGGGLTAGTYLAGLSIARKVRPANRHSSPAAN